MIARQIRSVTDLVLTIGLIAFVQFPNDVTVSFDGVPAGATSVEIADWRDDAPSRTGRRESLHGGRVVTLSAAAGRSVLVIFSRADGAYVLDGPFTWPEVAAMRTVDQEWRRTVGGSGNDASARSPLEWISTTPGPWPRCAWHGDDRWECWGVPIRAAGVIASQYSGRTHWSAVAPGATTAPPFQASAWGRLIRLRSSDVLPPGEAKVRRPVAPPAYRLRSIRLETADVRATAMHAGDDEIWVASNEMPPGAWIEVSAGDLGPAVIPIQEIASGPLSVPYVVSLSPAGEIRGRVVDGSGVPVVSVLVSLFRLIDPPETLDSRARGEPRARRVGAGEAITGSDGRFGFEKLPEGDFEVLAWHAQMGRTSSIVKSPAADLTIHLAPRAIVSGRVLVHGSPIPGVAIVSVPDASAISAADDLTELKGGDGRTGPDGRFVVALAEKGGGELRIGGGTTAVRRVPLPRGATAASLDVGDVDLPAPAHVTFLLDQDPGCDLVAVGPLGHTGLQIVPTRRKQPGMFDAVLTEEGNWRVTLSCGQIERRLVPPIVKISEGTRTVDLRVQ